MDNYKLVYSLLDEPIRDSWNFAYGSIGGLLVFAYSKYVDKTESWTVGIYLGLIAGVVFGVAAILIPIKSRYDLNQLQKRYKNNEFMKVEGSIRNFKPMPFEGHMNESFTVDGVSFNYTDYSNWYYGFRNTKSHGGPLDKNLYVRIGYVIEKGENVIWKIEIKK